MDYSKFLRRRLVNIGLNREDASKVALWFIQQKEHQGDVRAVDYFKRVGDTILWYLYDSPEKPRWVATKHRFPKALYFLKKYEEKVLVRVAKVARTIRFDSLKDHQVNKVVQGAIGESKAIPGSLPWLSELVKLGVAHLGFKPSCEQPSEPRPIGRVFRRVQSLSGPTPLTMEPPVYESLKIVNKVPALYGLPYWKEAFYPLSEPWLEDYFERFTEAEGHAVGEIHAAQEGGGKLRMYASPYSIVQCLLYPIHYWIDRYRRLLATDCTYDQLSGAEWAQARLREGLTVYSVDLSTATCRFPLSTQLELLSSLGLSEPFTEALRWSCRGVWKVGPDLPGFPHEMRWAVGQPLGIAPSMSMFSLTHNLLITGMCVSLGLDPVTHFRVLGDDVVLVNPLLYEVYTRAMELCGVPISWHKTHKSSKVAEFAGATISRDLVLRPGQWREAGINNHLSLATDLGKPLVGEVSNLWLEAEKLWLFVVGSYDPPVSDWSKFIRYSTAIQRVWDFETIPEPIHGQYWETGIRRLIHKQFMELSLMGRPPEFGPRQDDLVGLLFNGLPETEPVKYWRKVTSWANAPEPDFVFVHGWTALTSSLQSGELDFDGFTAAVDRLVANTHSLFYRVPKTNKVMGATKTKELLKVLAS